MRNDVWSGIVSFRKKEKIIKEKFDGLSGQIMKKEVLEKLTFTRGIG